VEVGDAFSGHSFSLNPELAQQAEQCKVSFLCSPNNPTGHVIERNALREFANQQLARQQLVVMDEAYIEFAPETSALDLVTEFPNLVILRTLSKAYALAGCRIGIVIAQPAIIALLRRIIAPYPLPTPTVALAMQALSDKGLAAQRAQLATLAQEKTRLLDVLNELDWVINLWPGEANFVLMRVAHGQALLAAAAQAGIRLRDQSAQPGLDNTIRITIGQAAENQTLIKLLQQWTPPRNTA
ncbi:MAG: aminotransferase class I/II-fold pyridoxal phosphate-dependent enzyme, partial [Pseudomonadota bacterium]